MPWKVNFFQTQRGGYPINEFIEGQDEETVAKITSAIDLLEAGGPFLKPPYIKKLRDKLYEVRVSGKVAIRIFYTIRGNEYYLLHIFKKKSQKTPVREMKTALDRMKELVALR